MCNLDGTPSIACGKCETWQHIECTPEAQRSGGDEEDFICESCACKQLPTTEIIMEEVSQKVVSAHPTVAEPENIQIINDIN